ncbi:hypothetical protein NYR54_04345 [Chelativorans sp. SCAU2101]|uniref:Uncharacterized protein n=1 Tax=Chelativorans petroleitrophicus TaxID=2975484 RepID=A0A9X3B5R2_9HYPH|nr:hypothetical protein [Chelativorans petroleitrophicus]MCT8989528.1 hypothetical protein [Chelativorans petroleitrophicus]
MTAKEAKTLTWRVVKARVPDTARDVIRLHKKHRGTIGRHDVVKLSANGNSCHVSVLGTEEEDVIEMDLDTRLDLGVMHDQTYEFSLTRAGVVGQLRWYLDAKSPAIRIPAWLAFWSLLMGSAGAMLGLLGLPLAIFS